MDRTRLNRHLPKLTIKSQAQLTVIIQPFANFSGDRHNSRDTLHSQKLRLCDLGAVIN